MSPTPPSIPKISGRTLSRLRIVKDIGQKEVASRLLITQQAYSKIEKSEEIPLPRLRVILTALGSSLEELLELQRLLTEKK